MRLRLTVLTHATAPVDVVVEAVAGTTLHEARTQLLTAAGLPPDSPLHIDGILLPASSVLGRAPLVEGAVLSARPAQPQRESRARRPAGFLELHVVSGPDAGGRHRLTPGRHRVGRSPHVEVTLADADVSRVHACLDVGPGGVTLTDTDSTNGTRLDGVPQGTGPRDMPLGALVVLGSTGMVLRLPEVRRAAVTAGDDGRIQVNRAPRHVPVHTPLELRVPDEPARPEPPPFPVLAMVLPLLVSIPMALLWSPFALLLGLTTPVMLLGNLVSDFRTGRRTYRRAIAVHRAALDRLETTVAAELSAETLRRRDQAPDAAALATIVSTPAVRLWERGSADDDALDLRVGTADLPATAIHLCHAGATDEMPEPRLLSGVPVAVPLRRAGVVGVSGQRERVLGLAMFLVAQLATLHSPRNVRMVVLSDKGSTAAPDWGWMRWLPHVPEQETVDGGVSADPASLDRSVSDLSRLLANRRAARVDRADHADRADEHVVVVLDGAHRLRRRAGVAELLRDGPEHGMHLLCLDDAPGRLPVECAVTLTLTGETGTRVEVAGLPGLENVEVVADLVSRRWAELLARSMAPLRDATPDQRAGGVPSAARLLDLLPAELGLARLDPGLVAQMWRRTPRSTRAVLGVVADGVYAPDLRDDGPHVLVGGTTGSGKSELLQSLIASLSTVNRPDELTFVLVDYKGGAAFAGCARLAHTVGLVTDLDAHLTRRALVSLTAEIRRRERLLAAAGARDLHEYHELLDAGRVRQRLPRLVVVVDEFRVLAEEHPDFVSGLVRLATVGRSLGLHLVLATQRPGGVVSPDIKANVNLRIALRVRDHADSLDVVDAPDAASIAADVPGRALSRNGSGPMVEFQTARVGGRRPGRREAAAVVCRAVRAGSGPHRAPAPDLARRPASSGEGPTDLEVLADCLNAAAVLAGAERQPSPWLPPLPDVVTMEAVADPDGVRAGHLAPTSLSLGVVDAPQTMAQYTWRRDPAADGALAVVGTARSGRTGTLRAFAACAARISPERVHLYAVDGGGGGLASLAGLPHTGSVVPRGDSELLVRLLRRLATEVAMRRARSATGCLPEGTPAILFLLDGWEAVQREIEDAENGAGLDALLQVVREGPGVAVMPVLAGDRALLTGRLSSAVADRLLLRTADVTDAVLAGVPVKDVPDHMPPGRGLLVDAAGVRELQVARIEDLPERRWPDADPSRLPFRVDPLPARLTAGDLQRLAPARRETPATSAEFGVGGDDVRPVVLDLAEHPVTVVAGPPGSGRSTALATIADAVARNGLRPLVVRPRPGGRISGETFGPGDAQALVQALEAGEARPTVVLVDDVHTIDGTPLEPVVLRALALTPSMVAGVVLAGDAAEMGARFRGVGAEARRARAGILLSPTGYADGDLFGVSVARAPRVHPGRGYLIRRGTVLPVQVAAPTPALGMLVP